ncbi:MAG: Gfo/Idh/MocA family oxidoreductase [Candidatus Omnitrophica bacterium]|nr:Gfo/Idh/MocA family oxidoreductase [Candidatus Omnitrophota bacterium]
MKKVKVGYIGWLFYDNTEFSQPYAVCDVNEQKLRDYTRQHPEVKASTQWQRLAEDPNIDVVIISTPNQYHCEMASLFLEKGKAVFLEKPMGVNRKEINHLLSVQRRTGGRLAIDFELRVSAGLVRIKEIIASGEIGQLKGIEFVHHRGSWLLEGNGVWRLDKKRSGGLFFMEVCHEVDYLRYLMGEVVQVQSFKMPNILPQYPPDFPDNVFSLLFFESGLVATITASHTLSCQDAKPEEYPEKGHDMFFVFTGTEGSLRFDCIKEKLLVTRLENYPPGTKGKKVMFKRIEDFTGKNSHHDITRNRLLFLQACAEGKAHHQSTYDAWRSHCVCLAAEESAITPGFPRLEVDYSEE